MTIQEPGGLNIERPSIHGHDEAMNKDKNFTKWLLRNEHLYFLRSFRICKAQDRDKFLIVVAMTELKEQKYNSHAPLWIRCANRNQRLHTREGFDELAEKLKHAKGEHLAMIELNKSGDDKLDVTEKDDMDGLLKALAKQVMMCHIDLNKITGMSWPDNFNEECQRLKLEAMASIIENKKRILMPARSSAAASSSGPVTTPGPLLIQVT